MSIISLILYCNGQIFAPRRNMESWQYVKNAAKVCVCVNIVQKHLKGQDCLSMWFASVWQHCPTHAQCLSLVEDENRAGLTGGSKQQLVTTSAWQSG